MFTEGTDEMFVLDLYMGQSIQEGTKKWHKALKNLLSPLLNTLSQIDIQKTETKTSFLAGCFQVFPKSQGKFRGFSSNTPSQ